MLLQSFGDGGGGSVIGSVLGAIPVIGGILQGVASLFGFGAPSFNAQAVANWTATSFQAFGSWISNVFSWAMNALKQVSKFIGHAIGSFFKGIFVKLFHLIDNVHQWLEAKLRPVVDFIKKVRTWYDRYYKLYVRPWMNMLQHIRQVLSVMRALHIKWAAALDHRISQIESMTGGLFLQVKTILNGFIDILNSVIDPKMLLRKPILVLSIRRTWRAMTRVNTGMPHGFFYPSPRHNPGRGAGPIPLNFNFQDPAQNPPASSLLDDDSGLGLFSGFMPGAIPDDSAVDDASPEDYYNDDLYPDGNCSDAASCLREQFMAITEGNGNG
jgi:hypothetical protein